jgi:hypothetical protein
MIATVDGLLIQTFVDPDNAPTGHDLATATGTRSVRNKPTQPHNRRSPFSPLT